MSKRIIYKPDAPRVVKGWCPDTDDSVAGFHAFFSLAVPAILGILVLAVFSLVEFLLIPGEYGKESWYIEKTAVGSALLYLLGYGSYHAWRNTYVEARTGNKLMVDFDRRFQQLPRDLQAEASGLRQTALRFMRDHNSLGLQRCEDSLEELTKAYGHRVSARHHHDVKTAKEIGDVMNAAMQYRTETTAMFAGEIEAAKEESSPEPRVEILEGEIYDPPFHGRSWRPGYEQ